MINPILYAIAIFMGSEMVTAAEHVHKETSNHHQKASQKPEQKFQADELLKKNMQALSKIAATLHDKSSGRKASLADESTKIDALVKSTIEGCKLDPATDAAFHPILARIIDGNSQLKSGDAQGVKLIQKALNQYHERFE